MHEIHPTIERPDADIVESFKDFSTPIVSDVQDKNTRTLDSGIKPVYDEAFVVGPAVTVDAEPGDNLVIHRAITLAEPGDVIVVDASEYAEAGVWGELMSRTADRRDIAGAVIDGGVRDVPEVGSLEYPLFSRHISPKGSYKRLPGSINVPISCGGQRIEPGDIIIGDANGVATISVSEVDAVLEACEEKLSREEELQNTDVSTIFEDKFDDVLAPLEEDSH